MEASKFCFHNHGMIKFRACVRKWISQLICIIRHIYIALRPPTQVRAPFIFYHITSPWYLKSAVQRRVVSGVLLILGVYFYFLREACTTRCGVRRGGMEKRMKKEIKRKRDGGEEEKQEYKENDDEKERGP